MPFIDISGPIVSNTVYSEGQLVAKDVSITLPEIAAITTEIRAMGNMALPIWQLLEDMELTINKIGIDMGLAKLIKPQSIPIEIRFVHLLTDANGNTKNIGCKAFIRCIPKVIPGSELTPGESTENEVTATVTRYQMFADGEELWTVDRLAGLLKVGGVDYSVDINSML